MAGVGWVELADQQAMLQFPQAITPCGTAGAINWLVSALAPMLSSWLPIKRSKT
jgi:hypothetical protein